MHAYPLPLAHRKLVGYKIYSNYWIFAPYHFKPSYWLVLQREGFSGDLLRASEELDLLTIHLDRQQINKVFRLIDTPPDHWLTNSVRTDLETLVLAGRIKIYKVSKVTAQKLADLSNPIYSSRNVHEQTGDSLVDQRNQLAASLGQVAVSRWAKKDAADQKHWNKGWLAREGVEIVDVGAAVVDVIADLIVGLWDLATFVVTIVGNTIELTANVVMTQAQFYAKLATGDLAGVKEDLRKLGVAVDEAFKSYEAFKAKVAEGIKVFTQITNDPLSRGLVIDYLDSMYQSIEYRKSRTIGVTIVATVGVEVLLALATGGAGNIARRVGQVAAKSAKVGKLAKIGPFPARAIDEMVDLAKLLNKPALKVEKPPIRVIPEDLPKVKETPKAKPKEKPKTESKPETKPKPPPRQLEKEKVPCFKKNKKGTIKEYDRQLQDQKNGLNNMTVKEYLDGREAYANSKRASTAKFRNNYQKDLENAYRETGISKSEALLKAKEKMKTLNALHNPDMIAGGKDQVTTMGDAGVNKSIGSQWNNGKKASNLTRVEQLDEAAKKAVANGQGDYKMNADLHRCK